MINLQKQLSNTNPKIKTMEKLKKELKMEVEKTLITPQKAKQILDYNVQNRTASYNRVYRLSTDIRNGLWMEDTGDFIKISVTGELIDGQHRLMAIVRANVAVKLWICFNVPDNAKEVIDTNKTRSASDVFKIKGIKNYRLSTSIQLANSLLCSGNSKNFRHTLSPKEMLSVYYKKPEYYQKTYLEAQQLSKLFQGVLAKSEIGGYLVAFDEINYEKSRSFMNQLCKGVNVTNNVIVLLRNKLISDKINTLKKMPSENKKALMIKAFNLFCPDKQVKILKYDSKRENVVLLNTD